MKKICLVASDLDGTLLTSSKKITPRLYKTLENIDSKGILFVPSTGRVLDSLPDCVKELPFLKYVICSNGATVYDIKENKVIFNNFLTAEAVKITLESLEGTRAIVEIFMNGKAYIDRKIYENLSDYGIEDRHAHYILTTREPVDDIYEKIEQNKNSLENINIIFFDNNERLKKWAELKKIGHASITSSAHNNIEVTDINATKAKALEKLCKILDIDKENVLAMGDSDNDMDMLLFAGTSVAMENGDAHIKEIADIITENCDNEGAAIALERLIL